MENRVLGLSGYGSAGLHTHTGHGLHGFEGALIYGSSWFGRKMLGPTEIGFWPPKFVFQITENQVLEDWVSTGFLLISSRSHGSSGSPEVMNVAYHELPDGRTSSLP